MNLILPVRENIELRLLQESDAQALFDIIRENGDHLRKWFSWVDDDKDVEDTKKYIKEAEGEFSNKKSVEFLIWIGDTLVGGIALHTINMQYRKAAISYWIAEEFQGRGIVSDALKAILEYGFAELKLNRIEISCGVENTRSSALPKKFGFTFEGTSREAELIDGHFRNLEVYSLLANEWKK